ncbi:MAG TPA: polysaccharide deacetylase family protein [Candidatus Omnitrophota bacterium]|nr:polysaccharide deacetylase family protein [Candidatus Omnitrophota bacterium]
MGAITITFDDGYKDTFLSAAGFLHEKGLRATFAVPSEHIGNTLENRHVIDPGDIASLVRMGHEIASHTVSHKNILDVYNLHGEETVRREFSVSKKELEKETGAPVRAFVFPFIEANNNKLLRKIASEYYSSVRITTEKPVFNYIPLKDASCLIGTAFTVDVSLDQMNELAMMAGEHDLWLIEVFHLVSDKNTKSAHRDEPYRFFTHIDIFKEHIDFISKNKIKTLTQSEAADLYGAGSRCF